MTPISAKSSAWALINVLAFGAVSAFVGAFLAIVLDGGGFPLELLEGTPFTSALWPGLILGCVVGGTHLYAAIATFRHAPSALLASAVAGFAMLIWIFTEVAMLDGFAWLQAGYFAIGLLEVALVLALLGVGPSVASEGPPLDLAGRHVGTPDHQISDSRD